MGLGSKQVSGDGFDWAKNLMQTGTLELPKIAQMRHHQQQQQQEVVAPLKCPRCDSSNTKFCYYNNYNRSQPRHYCKSCRRHWTKGGTLRNVPVGGGRSKNKRQKTSNTTTTKKNSSNNNGMSNTIAIQPQQQQQLPIVFDGEKNLTDILYHSLIQPTTDYINNNNFLSSTTLSLDSLLPLPNYSSTSLTSLDNNPSSSMSSGRFQLPNIVFNYNGETDDHTTTAATTTTTNMIPWQTAISASNSMDPSTYWNWEDLNTIMSSSDVKPQWDIDSQTKQ